MLKRSSKIIILVLFAIFLVSLSTNAATIDFVLQDVDIITAGYDTGISSFIWQFDEVDSVNVTSFDVSGVWFFGSNGSTVNSDGFLKLQGVDNIWGMPLVDGVIHTLEYTGTLGNSFSYEFRDYSNQTIEGIAVINYDLSEVGNITFAPVPIPSAILLLGGGLLGLCWASDAKLKNKT
jgi:hypothetical protein